MSAVTIPSTAWADDLPFKDPNHSVSERVEDLLSRMDLDDKIGQMTQVGRKELNPASDLATYRIGALWTDGSETNQSAAQWADDQDARQRIATTTPLGIPLLFGEDAVHGHNYIPGATIFPHNVGLGATRDPDLAEKIGRATAEEIAGTGVSWNFAPCICVARNDRWGRTYEAFGEKPELATQMATIINGLQDGKPKVLATAKHYVGDGGTTDGEDKGDTQISEEELRAIHLPPFEEAIRRGVGSVMVSYSSWNGDKMHDHKKLITDVLKVELGFSGIVVSDLKGIERLEGDERLTGDKVRRAINAGIDMMLGPDYKGFISLLREEVAANRVPIERINDANRRILTKKFELGLFEHPLTDRSWADTVGSPEHRALAREAVRKSQVLLKNNEGVLPLAKSPGKIFVAGKSADNIGYQSGGWTMKWEGESGETTKGTTILQGIRDTVSSDATVTYNKSGDGIDGSYKAAIAVIGEKPYAEDEGDLAVPDSMGLDQEDLDTLSKLKKAGVPIVVVLVSGRPMDITDHLDDWDALVAAWLPGTEGAGVADVLFGDYNPTGKLPLTWMRSASQQPINDGDGKPELFRYGYSQQFPAT